MIEWKVYDPPMPALPTEDSWDIVGEWEIPMSAWSAALWGGLRRKIERGA